MELLNYLDYILAAFGGSVIAFIELLRSFPKNIDSVLRNFWGWNLIFLNAFFACIFYIILNSQLPDEQSDSPIIALVIGLGFHTFLRSRLIFYRSSQPDLKSQSTSSAEEISLKLDEIYQSLQKWFYDKILNTLAEEKERQATIIIENLGVEEINIRLVGLIGSYPNATPMQQKEKLIYRTKYNNILKVLANKPKDQSIELANLFIEISTRKNIQKLIKKNKNYINNKNIKYPKNKNIAGRNKLDQNEKSLKNLVHAITISENNFSLILVRCNNLELCPDLIRELQKYCPVKFQYYFLNSTNNNLYLQIKYEIDSKYPPALIIYGFDKLHDLDALLNSANNAREQLVQACKFPLVFWVNDLVLKRLVIVAPDFYSLATVPIIFEV